MRRVRAKGTIKESQRTDLPAGAARRPGRGSLNTAVYEAIKERILANRARPGNKLAHQQLAEALGVSRTPVREALERLYQEGFVTRVPRRGFFVAEIDETEAKELYELREALETYALRRSMERSLTASELARLERLNRTYGSMVRDDMTRQRMLVDREFHLFLASLAGNRSLLRTLEATFERLILKIRVEGYRTIRGAEAHQEHTMLLDALRAHQPARAEQILTRHIRGACRHLIAHLRDTHDPDPR